MWLVGVVVRRYIDFLVLLIPTPLVSVLFFQQHPYFLFIFLNIFLLLEYIYIIFICAFRSSQVYHYIHELIIQYIIIYTS